MEKWKCPKCETINREESCVVCGQPREVHPDVSNQQPQMTSQQSGNTWQQPEGDGRKTFLEGQTFHLNGQQTPSVQPPPEVVAKQPQRKKWLLPVAIVVAIFALGFASAILLFGNNNGVEDNNGEILPVAEQNANVDEDVIEDATEDTVEEIAEDGEDIEESGVSGGERNGLVWVVLPELEYERIYLCCDVFSTEFKGGYVIDRRTGQLTGERTPESPHGLGGNNRLVYDKELGLFGWSGAEGYSGGPIEMYPLNELPERFAFFRQGMFGVERVDSSRRIELSSGMEILAEDAFTGEYGVMYNGRFVTDFIFCAIGASRFNEDGEWQQGEFVGVQQGERWGFVNTSGEIVIPFVFEHAPLIIDRNTAFARYNGKYGILDLHGSVNRRQETEAVQKTIPPENWEDWFDVPYSVWGDSIEYLDWFRGSYRYEVTDVGLIRFCGIHNLNREDIMELDDTPRSISIPMYLYNGEHSISVEELSLRYGSDFEVVYAHARDEWAGVLDVYERFWKVFLLSGEDATDSYWVRIYLRLEYCC